MLRTDQLLYILPFIVSTLILGWNTLYAWKRREVAGAREFAAYVFIEFLWIAGFNLELLSNTLAGKLFWDDFQYACMILAAITYGIFILRYVKGHVISSRMALPAWAVSLVLVFFAITDSLHHTIRTNAKLISARPFNILTYDFGWGMYLLSTVTYIIMIAGVFLLVVKIMQSQREFIKQSSTILLGIMIPMVGGIFTLAGVDFYNYRDISPFTFTAGSIVIIWGLFKYGLFDMVPIAMHKVLDTLDDIVIVFDNQHRLIFLNRAGKEKSGKSSDNLFGRSVYDIFPEKKNFLDHFKGVYQAEEEVEIKLADGKTGQFMLKMLPLSYGDHQKDGRVIVLTDITKYKLLNEELRDHKELAEMLVEERTLELKQRNQDLQEEVYRRVRAEAEIKANLEEKTVLVEEINHRVRNNMSVIISLLNLQTQYFEDTEYKKPITEIKNRIYSMSLVHDMMYDSGNFKHVSIREYVVGLYGQLYYQKRTDLKLKLDVDMEDITISINQAIPLGLILNEVITNAITHAFTDASSGRITVTVHRSGKMISVSVRDDGIGFNQQDPEAAKTFGLRIIELLVEQLAGEITYKQDQGTEVCLKFNIE